ncbi:MAG: chitobiase/beta-hexosaminidase C-terminal domain-containing protein [Bacteroidales bacterium]|nr:chitobiase/beta-hexosaminidase C-terminal domain-containing protein [Bacteroidales bacterium]
MKKLLYSGLTALMMLFAIGSAKAAGTLPTTATEDASIFTITPASGSTVNPGTVLSITAESKWIVYVGYANQEAADAATINGFQSFDEYGQYTGPVITKDACVFMIAAQVEEEDGSLKWKYTYVNYTVNTGDIADPTFYVNNNYITNRRITATDKITIVPEDDDENTKIWYTIDGTAPAKNTGTEYAGEFSLTEDGDVVVKAIAVNSTDQTSAVVEAHFTVGEAVKPQVALYTTTQSEITAEYGKYVPFYAMAFVDGEPAEESMVFYTIDGTTEPSMDAYYAQVEDDDWDGNGPIYYVTGDPEGDPFPKIMLTGNSTTLKVIAYAMMEGADEPVGSDVETYSLTATTVANPTLTEAAGEVESGTVVKIEDADDYALILYTMNGTVPSFDRMMTGDDDVYTYDDEDGIEITEDVTVNVIAYTASGMSEMRDWFGSDMVTVAYTVAAAAIPAPVITPNGGAVVAGTEVTIAAASGSTVDKFYYTTDGSTPTAASTEYSSENPIIVNAAMTLKAIGVQTVTDGDDLVSAVATAEFTIKTPVTIAFDPANGAEVEVGDEITLTASSTVADMLYRWYASMQEAEDAEWDDEGAEYYSDGKPTVEAGKPVLRVRYAEEGADETVNADFYAAYTIKAGETPVDPNKLSAPKFMTDSYGESRYAKKTDKVRLVLDSYDSIELYYAVIVEETEEAGGFKKSADGELTFVKYDSTLISLGQAGDALNVTVKAFALKGEKSSDTVEARYTMVDNIDAYLSFKAFTGKNYPLYFTVYSDNYDEIMDKDFMVYYTLDGTTEPTMEGYYAQSGDTIKYTAQIQQEDHLEMAFCELTQDTTVKAKAYVMLDADAEVILEVAVESHRVTVNSIEAPTFSVSDAVEYSDTIKVAINMPEAPEGANTTVYYTLDGSEPLAGRLSNNSELAETVIFEYWEGDTIKIAKNTTVKAIAYQMNGRGPAATVSGSDIATANYKFRTELTFNPASGTTVTEGRKVTITADNDVDIFYMMFESEEAAKAAEWNQEEAELYSGEMQPVLSKKNNTIKAAYAHQGAEAVSGTFFYATYTVESLPALVLTFNPASGAEVADSTKVTITTSRELAEDEYIMFAMFASKEAADTCSDDEMLTELAKYYGEPDPEDETIGYPVITKAAPVLKAGYISGMDEEGNWILNWTIAEYKVKEQQQGGDSTAVEGKELAGVSIYPNPTDGEFNVVAPANANVEIFNAAGVLVKRLVVAEGNVQVRLDNSGIYFVRVRANGQMAVKKVVIR